MTTTAPIHNLSPAELSESIDLAERAIASGVMALLPARVELQRLVVSVGQLHKSGMPLPEALRELLFGDGTEGLGVYCEALLASAEMANAILVRQACSERLGELAGRS